MSISPFFLQLRSAYQSELDDLSFDSEGRDVLKKRLAAKRQELDFLRQMIELSPEMVAVVFHQGFRFKLPGVIEHLLAQEPDEFPDWEALSDAVVLAPWAEELAEAFLREPQGGWLLTVAAALEYMHQRPGAGASAGHGDDDEHDDEDGDRDGDEDRDHDEDDEDAEARANEEAGAEWLVEQGFDHKD